ncbi:hypothetical protein TNCV_4721381 [Trichonephila clavipes]|uniref:Uncharacterized protein n=1 Tax=Trichonephila clavipes TaxID=2585209 RepID=A0A8X7BF07_TRICX|nr:hypothetical protein TNCV_4721381 [Trichonephila clavipes]
MEVEMYGHGRLCGLPISIWQDMSIHRIAEYGQHRIHLPLNHFILQRSLYGVGLWHHLSAMHFEESGAFGPITTTTTGQPYEYL